MNVFLFFIIIGIAGMLIIVKTGKRNKWVDKHFLKLLWGFWAACMVTMFVSIEMLEDKEMVKNKRLLESKSIRTDTFHRCHKERNGLDALLETGDEKFYFFTTEDGKQYQVGASSVIKEQTERPFTGYRYFYLFKAKGKNLYKLE